MTVISPPRQLVSSFFGIARILFPVAIPLILLLIPAGCCYSCAIPPPGTEKMLLSSPWAQNESQVTPAAESPDSELAAAFTAEATALFRGSLFLEAEEKFLNALEIEPSHISALTGLSKL